MPCAKPEQMTIWSGMRAGAAHPVQVVGQRLAQLRQAPAVEIAEPIGRRVIEHAADRAQPGAAGKLAHVGTPVAEGDLRLRCGGRTGSRRLRGGGRRHGRGTSRPGAEVALRDELLVRLDHHAARQSELAGQRPRRRHRGAARQPPVAHGIPQLLLELPMEWLVALAVERHEQLEL